jgi:hypothetical protein
VIANAGANLPLFGAEIDLKDHQFVGVGMWLGASYRSHLEFDLSKRVYRDHRTSIGPDNRITEQCSQKKKHPMSRRNHRDYFSLRHPDGPLSCHDPTAMRLIRRE